jgi:hypothetical protein
VPSSVVAEINYDPHTCVLRINFVSGMIYEYLDVPENIYLEMKGSGAKGIYLNQHIKGKYAFKKVT